MRTGEVLSQYKETKPLVSIENVSDGIVVTYNFPYATIKEDTIYSNKYFINFKGLTSFNTSSYPALPFDKEYFILPDGCKATVSVIDSTVITMPLEIAPARNSCMSKNTELNNSRHIPAVDANICRNHVSAVMQVKNFNYKKVPVLSVMVSPVRYNPLSGNTMLYSFIKYKITYVNTENRSDLTSNKKKNVISLLNNVVANNTDMNNSFRESALRTSGFPMELGEKYLILTVPEHEASASILKDWKKKMGYNVMIENRLSWDTASIKSFVSSIDDLSYLLIIGNQQQVPGRVFSDGFTNGDYVSDFCYGCINNDDIQEVYVGRIIADNDTESRTFVNKIINYESNPTTDTTFYKTAIHATCLEDNPNAKTTEDIAIHAINNGYDVKRVYEAYPTNVNLDYWPNAGLDDDTIPFPQYLKYPNFIWNGGDTDILNNLNQGAFYVMHLGHGNISSWANPSFFSYSSLTNGSKLPVFFDICCYTGNFGNYVFQNTDCFAHSITTLQNGGSIAIFAATERGVMITCKILAMSMIDAFLPDSAFFPRNLFISNTY